MPEQKNRGGAWRSGRLAGSLLAVWAMATTLPPMALADSVVSTNDSADTIQQKLDAGGTVTFDSDGQFSLSNTLVIRTNVVLDGGDHEVTFSGGGAANIGTNTTAGGTGVRLFQVNTGVRFALQNLTLADGQHASGGAIYNQGTLTVSNCAFLRNVAVGADGTAGRKGADSDYGMGDNGSNGGAGAAGKGGAICNMGAASIFRSLFLTNLCLGGNGGSGGNGGDGPWQGGNGGNGGNGGSALGGAVYSSGTLQVADCLFNYNHALAGHGGYGGTNGTGAADGLMGKGGAGAEGSGGAIYNAGTAQVSGSSFVTNSCAGGDSQQAGTPDLASLRNGYPGGPSFGAAVCNVGTLGMANCTVYRNELHGGAGGNAGDGREGSLGYGDGGNGGNAWGGGVYNSSTAKATNCTLSEGFVLGGEEGVAGTGPYVGSDGDPGGSYGGNLANNQGTFVLVNCIIANALGGTNVVTTTNITTRTFTTYLTNYQTYTDPYTGAIITNGYTVQTNTVTRSTTNVVTITNATAGINAYGNFTDGGYNLSSSASPTLNSGTSLSSRDPLLGSLATNGGFTPTLALLAGSPAIDAGHPSLYLPTDQRGFRRPEGGRGDIGAFEQDGVNLKGRITETSTNGAPVAGVTVTAGDTQTTTGSDGRYAFTNLAPGSYVVTVALDGFDFQPPVQVVTVAPTSVGAANFVAVGYYSVAGRVVSAVDPASPEGLGGVTVFCGTNRAVTDVDGYYLLSGVGPGLRTISATNSGYAFAPTNRQVEVSSAMTEGVDFDGFNLVTVSGSVYDFDSLETPIKSVKLTLRRYHTNAENAVFLWTFVTTNRTNGYYYFTNVPAGTVQITPSKSGYGFDPPAIEEYAPLDTETYSFLGFRAYSISGRVTYNSTGLANVVIDVGSTNATTDASGNYSIAGLPSDTYTVTPFLDGYQISPDSRSVTLGSTNATGVNFTAKGALSISGQVERNGSGLGSVTITVNSKVITNSATGYYGISNLPPGTYQVTPYRNRYSFDPGTVSLELSSDSVVQDFQAIATVSVSGRVTKTGGGYLNGAKVTVGSQSATTDANGYYALANVAETNLAVPSGTGYWFTPAYRLIQSETNLTAINFVASPAAGVSGRLVEGTNGVPNVVLAARGTNVANVSGTINLTSTTDTSGRYSFSSLPRGNYTFEPPSAGVGYTPSNVSLALTSESVSNVNFTANPPQIGIRRLSTNATATLTVLGLPSRTYKVLENTNSVNSTNWRAFATNATSTAGSFSLTVTNNLTNGVRFFKPGLP